MKITSRRIQMQPKYWIVTGANGHFANTLVRELTKRNDKVGAFVLPGDRSDALSDLLIRRFEGDVTKIDDLRRCIDAAEVDPKDICVVHAAGIVSIDFKEKDKIHKVNVEGTQNVATVCLEKGVGRMVYVSSVHAIKEVEDQGFIQETDRFSPEDVEGLYAKSKAQATCNLLKLQEEGLPLTLVFPSGMIGPNDYGCSHMTQMVIDFGTGRLKAYVKGGYDFVDVRDVSEALIKIVETRDAGDHYILSGEYISVKEIVDVLAGVFPEISKTMKLPLGLAKLSAPFAEIYYRILKQKPLYTRYSLFTLASNSNFSHAKATEDLAYRPRKATESLRDMALWLIQQNRIKKGS
ncbi:MAG TPA: dihydroflavonol 4-reductase [Erysipelotrichaceae bacterium]|nr:dihydroflavonol 4-reductase [Erysipelotrichaceae bacterium]HBZ40384.1 dihydroflavonol 4-reductase [Erysipelotrichaceae bacterium]